MVSPIPWGGDERVAFEQRPEGRDESHVDIRGRLFQVEGAANAKGVGRSREHQRPLCLEPRAYGKVAGVEDGEEARDPAGRAEQMIAELQLLL